MVRATTAGLEKSYYVRTGPCEGGAEGGAWPEGGGGAAGRWLHAALAHLRRGLQPRLERSGQPQLAEPVDGALRGPVTGVL